MASAVDSSGSRVKGKTSHTHPFTAPRARSFVIARSNGQDNTQVSGGMALYAITVRAGPRMTRSTRLCLFDESNASEDPKNAHF
jgi:hypothetical protein